MDEVKVYKSILIVLAVIAIGFVLTKIHKEHMASTEQTPAMPEEYKVVRAVVPKSGIVFNVYAYKEAKYLAGDTIVARFNKEENCLEVDHEVSIESRRLVVLENTAEDEPIKL